MGTLLSSSCLPRRNESGAKWSCALLGVVGRAAGCPRGEAGLVPNDSLSIQLDHLVPKINMDWSSWLLSPSMGPGSCAGRQDTCQCSPLPSCSPPWEAPHHPAAARCPALSLKPKQGPESCHPLHSQGSAPANNFRGLLQLPSLSFPELSETWLRFFSPIQGRGFGHHKGVTSTPADRSLPLPNLFLPTPSSAASQGGSLAQDHPAPHAAEPLTSSSGERQGQSEPLLWPS